MLEESHFRKRLGTKTVVIAVINFIEFKNLVTYIVIMFERAVTTAFFKGSSDFDFWVLKLFFILLGFLRSEKSWRN